MGDLLQHLFRWNFTSAHMRGAVSHGQSLKWACQLMVSMSAWWGNIIPHLRESRKKLPSRSLWYFETLPTGKLI